jgi:hypothetical protein
VARLQALHTIEAILQIYDDVAQNGADVVTLQQQLTALEAQRPTMAASAQQTLLELEVHLGQLQDPQMMAMMRELERSKRALDIAQQRRRR